MDAVFLRLLNLSLTAGWLVLAVIAVRLLLRRAPKCIACALWALVAIRLLCPVSFQSALSLVPSAEPVPPTILQADVPEISTGFAYLNDVVNPVLFDALAPTTTQIHAVTPIQAVTRIAAWVWLTGMTVMLLWAIVSWARLRLQLRTAVRREGRVWQSERVSSPFVLGMLRPRIYLPFSLNEEDAAYVLAHENAHIRRRDHWVKPFGFLLLAVYWFHPLIWVAYALFCRDIEMACDERVVRTLDEQQRRAYSAALLNCSVHPRALAACPLAFGEVGIRTRIKAVLNYKKPTFWVVLTALIACAALTVCFLTNPRTEAGETPAVSTNWVLETTSNVDGLSLSLTNITVENGVPVLHTTWQNETAHDIFFGEVFSLEREENNEWVSCSTESAVFHAIAYILKAGESTQQLYNTAYFDMTTPGKYRLATICWFDQDAAPDDSIHLSVTFEYTDISTNPPSYPETT